MSTLRNLIRQIAPVPARRAFRHSYNKTLACSQAAQSGLIWRFHPKAVISRRRLCMYKDKHKGQRCFVIGNGPSLKKMDLSLLRDEFTFGMNRIYLLFPELGFHTSYLVSVNDLVIQQCAQDIQRLPLPKFLSWRAMSEPVDSSTTVFLRSSYSLGFSTDLEELVYESATVTNVALQLAFYMGFSTVILIGVDHSFASKGKPNTTVVSDGSDPNHFSPDYFGKGFRWQLPDLDISERGYLLAREAFEKNGRQILDATVDGKLQIFPKVEYGAHLLD
jgi:hypothetical protein